MPPDFLAIGHVSKDLTQDGYVLGAVTFAALTAKAFGLSPAVVTSCGTDIDPHAALRGIPVHVVASAETTTFVNVYERGGRRQSIAVLSDHDSAEAEQIDGWIDLCPVVIHTHGGRGCSVHVEAEVHRLPAFPVREVDPTGAGDVCAAAYLIRFQESGDPLDAARFAVVAASFCVEAEGVLGIPTRADVEDRLWKASTT